MAEFRGFIDVALVLASSTNDDRGEAAWHNATEQLPQAPWHSELFCTGTS